MGLTERHWFEYEEPELAEQQLEDAVYGTKNVKFIFDGCDISFVVEAPENITLKELLAQADKIQPEWCACGIRSLRENEKDWETEIYISKGSVRLANDGVCAKIVDSEQNAE